MAATTADLVNTFIELDRKRKAKEGELDKLKEELNGLEQELLKRFENAGQQSFKSTAGITVYIHRQLWAGARDKNMELLVTALRTEGLADLVKESANTQTLSAYIREQAKAAFGKDHRSTEEILKILPESLQGAIALTEHYSLRTTRG